MINKIIRFSIDNKLVIVIFLVALLGFGIYSLKNLPIDAVPDITNNQVQIITVSPTLAAEEVERFITYPVEVSMATIPGVTEIRSVSRFGLSVITIVFEDNVSVLEARQMTSERLKNAESQMPQGLGIPEMAPVTTGLGEIFQYLVKVKPGFEDRYDAMELRTIQDWIIKRQLLGTKGVADVSSFGGFVKQYEISIDPEKLRSMNITLLEVFNALENNNQNTGGAYIDKKPNAYFIRGIGLISGKEDIEEIVIKNVKGIPVLLRNIAELKYGFANRYGALTENAEGEAVGAIVLMLKDENSSQVVKNVKERIAEIEKTMPEGVMIVPFLDRTRLVDNAIQTVSKNLMEGALIVIFVLVLFLGNLRAGLIVASVIPLAMLFAISMMYLTGVSGNLMSLGAIDFGLIVDGAVIIVESVMHHIGQKGMLISGSAVLTKKEMEDEVFESSSKMMNSAAFGQIIILIVYLPILALVGIEGKMFRPMAETVSFAILGALILSVTYIPMMSSVFLSRKVHHKKTISDKMMDYLQKVYKPVILFALRSKVLVLSVAIALLIVSYLIFSRMGGEFIPTLEEGDFAVETRLMPGSSLSQTIETTLKASEILLENFPEVVRTVGKIGTAEIPTDPMPIEACDLMVILKDKDEWTSAASREELADKMTEALRDLPGVSFGFQQPIQMRFNELMSGAKQDVAIKIFGEDLSTLAIKAEEVAGLIQNVQGVADIYVEPVTGLPQITITHKRNKIAEYGLNISTVNTIIKSAFAGSVAGQVFEGDKRFDLVVRLNEKYRKDIEDIKNIYLSLPNGNQVPITEVAEVSFSEGPIQISREQTRRRIVIGVNVRDRDVESLVNEIKAKLDAQLKLPPGYLVDYGGQFENMVEAKARLSIAVPVALALILVLLFFAFGSFRETLLIFSAIPFSAIGGVFALLIRGMPFSISAGIGFIALFGVAVLNGIVLIGYFNQLKKEGISDIKERILKGTEARLRPVLMTASVASLGFLPMALSGSSGAEVQKPLATVVIGGLVTATLLTLVVLPVLYSIFEKKENNKGTGMTPPLVALIAILFWVFPSSSNAQNGTIRYLTAEAAIDEAYKNNPAIQAVDYEIESGKALQKSSLDIPKTNASLMYGQFNSVNKDNSITISQSIAFPGVYTSQRKVFQEQVQVIEQKKNITKNELRKNVRSLYFQLIFLKERQKLLLYQDSLFSSLLKASELRYKTGESNHLEKVNAESQYQEIKLLIIHNASDLSIFQRQLQNLLNTKDIILPSDSLSELTLQLEQRATNNPYLNYLQQQLDVEKALVRLEKYKMFPDFSIGYFNQSIQGLQNVNGTERYFGSGYRFHGVIAGVSLPIWYKPYHARIKAIQLTQKAEESNLNATRNSLLSEHEVLLKQYKKYHTGLLYYKNSALPHADLIITNSDKAFRSGEISFMEYLLNMNRALGLKDGYLDQLNQFNQTIIIIEFIQGEK